MKRVTQRLTPENTSICSLSMFTGLAWFLIAVTPMLGLSNFGYHSHADRFTYLPSVGFVITVALAILICQSKQVFYGGLALWCTLVALLCVTTKRQISYWKNDEVLFSHALEIDPTHTNYIAHRNLGLYYYGIEHDLTRAVQHFDAAFAANTARNRDTQYYYIVALAESGDLERAKAETRDLAQWMEERVRSKLLPGINQIQPETSRLLDTFLAYALIAHLERDDELASEHLKYVLQVDPESEEAHYIKGLVAYDNERWDEAKNEWLICVKKPAPLRPYLSDMLAKMQLNK